MLTDKMSIVASHIGIDTFSRLDMWAREIARNFKCRVVVNGSSTRTKNWNDIDVSLLFPDERYTNMSNLGWGDRAWYIAAGALSVQASMLCDARVEVHIHTEGGFKTPEFEYLELAKP